MKSPRVCHVKQLPGNEVHIVFVCGDEDDATELFHTLCDRAKKGVLDIHIVTDETTSKEWTKDELTLKGN